MKREITKLRDEFGEEISNIHKTIGHLQADVVLWKRSMVNGGGEASHHAPKIDVPKPSPFVGKREARAVDDFLWEVEKYLEGAKIMDGDPKIKMCGELEGGLNSLPTCFL